MYIYNACMHGISYSVLYVASTTMKLMDFTILYSLKLSGTKTFMDFVVFQASTKILSMKISYKIKL